MVEIIYRIMHRRLGPQNWGQNQGDPTLWRKV